ncbi:hypothetical protein AB6866_23435 [Rahnella inusitata]|jgi:hypothetical protein
MTTWNYLKISKEQGMFSTAPNVFRDRHAALPGNAGAAKDAGKAR